MTKTTSTLKRALGVIGVALFLATPVTLAQFSLTWDFTRNDFTTGASVPGGAYASATVTTIVAETGLPANYLSAPAAGGNISWNGFPSGTTTSPAGYAPGGAAMADGWLFNGTTATPNHGWLQANGGPGTPIIGGTKTNPTWGNGTLASASYLVIDLPDFLAYGGDPLVLTGVTIEGGSHGQNQTAGPEVYGVYQLNGGLLGSFETEWGSLPLPSAANPANNPLINPWLYNLSPTAVVTVGTNEAPIAPGASFDLLFFAGYDVIPPNGTGPFILDNLTLNFGLLSASSGGGYGAPNGQSGTPEPAGALLGLLSLGMVSFRRKRRS